MLPLFSSSGVIHDILCLSIRCLIFPSLSICTHAESGYEREAPFGPVWLVSVSSWSLMAVSVPDAAGRQTPRPLAPSPPHSRPAVPRAGLFGRWKGVTHTWGWCPDTSCERVNFIVLYSVLFYSILFSYLHRELLCFSSLVHRAGLIVSWRVFLQTSIMNRHLPSVSHELFSNQHFLLELISRSHRIQCYIDLLMSLSLYVGAGVVEQHLYCIP